ncbi:MAG TPA: PH domain-containing protein [Gemmatimonadaceae bacterium]|nr:PH domain-containing protein [Gemmatimonadaceae bacterium]
MTPSDEAPATEPSPATQGRRLHPLTLLFSTVAIARRLILPAVFGGISAAGGDAGRAVLVILGVLTVPSIALAIAHYFTFRYAVTGEELVYRSGVLRRKQRVIPLSRVQNIEVRQSLAQRLTGVAELRVETAGSGSEPEAALSVLRRAEADALRHVLLARRRPVESRTVDGEDTGLSEPAPLVHLTPPELAVAGATANEAGLIAAALVGALQFADDLPLPLERYLPDVEAWFTQQSLAGTVLLVAALMVVLIVIGWVVSIVGSVVGYYDFTLARTGDDIQKRYGLLNRREASVPLRRVQSIRVEESLLRRPLDLASLKIETAGGPAQQQRGGAEAFVPIAQARRIAGLVQALFPSFALDAVELAPVHPRSPRRAFTRYALTLAIVAGGLALLDRRGLLVLALVPFAWVVARWQYRMRGYALADGHVVLRSGVLNRVTWIVPDEKIQTLHVTATPFQRRHGLASVVVDTASGGAQPTLVDVSAADAATLLERMAERARAARARVRAARRSVAQAAV